MDQRIAVTFAAIGAVAVLSLVSTAITTPAYAVVGGGQVEVRCAVADGTPGILITNTPHHGTIVVFNAPCVPPFSTSP